jgi:hypothetical protein
LNSVGQSGHERFAHEIHLDDYYKPYPMQAKFHASPSKHRLLGGAAGPGKTLGLIVDHMIAATEFSDPIEAVQVHTLLLRRTVPKLENTLVARFLEKIPKELYAAYNNTTKQVTWPNGATTRFGSMQYEHNAYDWQGQWYKIGYDELGEFTFKQWMATSAWNRCPVSPWATKDGASNPIGVGAGWIKSLFIDHEPCLEMEDNQRKQYRPEDYEYFPCTYLDNPVYANDPVFWLTWRTIQKLNGTRSNTQSGDWLGATLVAHGMKPSTYILRIRSKSNLGGLDGCLVIGDLSTGPRTTGTASMISE